MDIFRKLLAGCLAVTQNCIIHRDLKPANIIVSPSLEPKLIDFGFCDVIQAKKVMRTFNVGSPSYMTHLHTISQFQFQQLIQSQQLGKSQQFGQQNPPDPAQHLRGDADLQPRGWLHQFC
jgi:serine/threonine protein kinase